MSAFFRTIVCIGLSACTQLYSADPISRKPRLDPSRLVTVSLDPSDVEIVKTEELSGVERVHRLRGKIEELWKPFVERLGDSKQKLVVSDQVVYQSLSDSVIDAYKTSQFTATRKFGDLFRFARYDYDVKSGKALNSIFLDQSSKSKKPTDFRIEFMQGDYFRFAGMGTLVDVAGRKISGGEVVLNKMGFLSAEESLFHTASALVCRQPDHSYTYKLIETMPSELRQYHDGSSELVFTKRNGLLSVTFASDSKFPDLIQYYQILKPVNPSSPKHKEVRYVSSRTNAEWQREDNDQWFLSSSEFSEKKRKLSGDGIGVVRIENHYSLLSKKHALYEGFFERGTVGLLIPPFDESLTND